MINRLLAAIVSATLLASTGASAVDTSLQIQLGGDGFGGDFERRTVLYDCSDGEPFDVIYINAAPNFLALVPIADEPAFRIFAAVESASGARYAAGRFIWWTEGPDASLFDTTLGAEAAAVLTCSEMNNTP